MWTQLWPRILVFFSFAFLCQSVIPVVSPRLKDQVAEFIYSRFPTVDVGMEKPFVTILEVDRASIEKYGWPIPRTVYSDLLTKLKADGHPWVLSLLLFQSQAANEVGGQQGANAALATALKNYERYVGSGIRTERGAELDDEQEDFLRSQLIYLPGGAVPEGLPWLPLRFEEPLEFMKAQAWTALQFQVGTESVVNCTSLYIPVHLGPDRRLLSLLPTSLFRLASSLRSQLMGSVPPPRRVCVADPSMSTASYLARSGVERISLVDYLSSKGQVRSQSVLLTSDRMRRYQGPGRTRSDSAIVSEHLLLARFINEVVSGTALVFHSSSGNKWLAASPLFLAALLCFPGLTAGAILVILAVLLSLLLYAAYHVFVMWQEVFVPSEAILFTLSSLFVFSAFEVCRQIIRYRRQLAFNDRLRSQLSIAVDRAMIELGVKRTFFERFPQAFIEFSSYGGALEANPVEVSEIWKSISADKFSVLQNQDVSVHAVADVSIYSRWFHRIIESRNYLEANVTVRRNDEVLGRVSFKIQTPPRCRHEALSYIRTMASEICVHWTRLELLFRNNLAASQRLLLEQELQLGKQVQLLVIPSVREAKVGCWEFSLRFKPYGPLSGDWMQIFSSQETGVAVLAIGDVVGKGTGAALITSSIASIWKSLEKKWKGGSVSAVEILEALDSVIRDLFKGEQNTTISLAVLTDSEVLLFSAGAPPWLHLRASGDTKVVRARPPVDALGAASSGQKIVPLSVQVGKGDILFAHTDGLMDGPSARNMFLASVRQCELPMSFSRLVDLAESAGAGHRLEDDATVLMIKKVR